MLNGIKTVNLMCDRAVDVMGNPIVVCQSEGTFSSTGVNNVQCVNVCCNSDYCNLEAKGDNRALYCVVLLMLSVIHCKFEL